MKENFTELRVFVDTGNYAKTAKALGKSAGAAGYIKKKVENQAWELLHLLGMVPAAKARKLLTDDQYKYYEASENVKGNRHFFAQMLKQYTPVAQPLPTEDKLLSSLTVSEFKELMKEILTTYKS